MDPKLEATSLPPAAAPPPLASPPQHDQLAQVPPPAAPVAIKRRAPIACRRCRRMRSKCVHKNQQPPCQGCQDAGLGAEDCDFPKRGQPDADREYRHPRMRAERPAKRSSNNARRDTLNGSLIQQPGPAKPVDEWEYLPPVLEIVDSVERFTRHYFQLGFIPKQLFPDRLRSNHRSVSVFLIYGILSISARFTPALIARYGGNGMKVAEMFMERAAELGLSELYQEPTLERCQAFYLLSIAQQGSGWKNKSYINLGIAMRMATLMRLHREETYILPQPVNEHMIIQAESARRTLWMLHSQDNLHSGPSSPVSLSASDITALLPSNEEDFARAHEPESRAALEGTPPALENPQLIYDPHRSLFATLIQTHHLWGIISRSAVRHDRSSAPWDADSDYARMVAKLNEFENSLPHEHKWGPMLLHGFKHCGQDLAYLAVTMVTRLCNIVLRKTYLLNIMHRENADQPELREFWGEMSDELFKNVRSLFDQIDTQFKERTGEEGTGAQMAAFCVYSCGIMATYLCKFPTICPTESIAREGRVMLDRTMEILAESQEIWPLASRWLEGLQKFAHDQRNIGPIEGSMAEGVCPPFSLNPRPRSIDDPWGVDTNATIENAQRDPIPHALAVYPENDPKNNQQPQPPISSPTSNTQIAAQVSPTPDMFIDPSIRLATTPQQQAQAGLAQAQQQQHAAANNLDLLVRAIDPSSGMPAHMGGPVPYDPAAHGHAHADGNFYGQPQGPTSDGFEEHLQYFLEGPPQLSHPVWGQGMYYQV